MKAYLIHHSTIGLGIALVIMGLIIRALISRRRFNRRGIAGLQLFSSYWKWLVTTRIESLINSIAFLLVIAVFVLLACGWYAS